NSMIRERPTMSDTSIVYPGTDSTELTIPDTEIRKSVDRRFIEQQAIVTQAAHELSTLTDLFYTPQVLGYNIADQTLCLERLNNLIPLRDLLEEARSAFWVLGMVARSMAFIHSNLHIFAEQRVSVPP